MEFDDKDAIRNYRKREKEDQELCRLFLELVLLLSGKRDDTNQLAFQGREVGPDDTDWNSVSLSEVFEFVHFLFHVDLNDCCSFEDVSAFIELNCEICVFILNICFLYDWN